MASPVRSRPAETAGGGLAGVTVLLAALGASKPVIAVAGAAAGIAPGAVTALVNAGGIVGVWRLLTHGRQPNG